MSITTVKSFGAALKRAQDERYGPSTAKELARLTKAARIVAAILDAGKRDPRWSESQALEEAAIAYGRAVTQSKKARR